MIAIANKMPCIVVTIFFYLNVFSVMLLCIHVICVNCLQNIKTEVNQQKRPLKAKMCSTNKLIIAQLFDRKTNIQNEKFNSLCVYFLWELN